MNIEDQQDETEAKAWEEALSLVESISKDAEKSPDSDDPNDLLLDVARWKVVWGKKPAQYRLKPFLMWSVEEMPSIPEECESFPEATEKTEEVIEMLKMKKDKQMRFLKRKMFKMKSRIDEINVVLAKTLTDETVASMREEDPTKAAKILQLGAQRVELLDERNNIRDKLQKLNKKLISFKGPSVETKRLSGQRQDVGDVRQDVKGAKPEEQPPSRSELHAGEPWNRGRRLAIKKEAKSIWNKPGSAKDAPRSSCELGVDRKAKKKRCCRGNHKKHESKVGSSGETDVLGRQALSESDLRADRKDQGETSLQKHSEVLEGDGDIKTRERRASSKEFYKVLKDRLPSARAGQEISQTIPADSKARTRRNSVSEGAALRNDEESTYTEYLQPPKCQIELLLKKDVNRAASSATDLGVEGQKRSPETTKNWKTKRSDSNTDKFVWKPGDWCHGTMAENAEPADSSSKYRPSKSLETPKRAEKQEVPGKRTVPISNVPS